MALLILEREFQKQVTARDSKSQGVIREEVWTVWCVAADCHSISLSLLSYVSLYINRYRIIYKSVYILN